MWKELLGRVSDLRIGAAYREEVQGLDIEAHSPFSSLFPRLTIECVYLEATVQKRLLRPGDEC